MIIEWIKSIFMFLLVVFITLPIVVSFGHIIGDFWINAINWLIKGVSG